MTPRGPDGAAAVKPTAVFMGTPEAAVPILSSLTDVADVVLVVTRPDKPRGRSKRLVAPPVKDAAEGLGLAVAQPSSGVELLELVRAQAPTVAIVAAFGRLIGPELLELPDLGFVNVHYSLLPRWRGASPVVRAILAGDRESGVSLIKMDAGLDTGPVIAAEVVVVDDADDAGRLTLRLASVGGRLLAIELPPYLDGRTTPVPQDESLATAAAKVTTNEAHIDPLRHSVDAVDRAVRAFNPNPGAWCLLDGERFKISATTAAGGVDSIPGEVRIRDGHVILGCRTGPIELVTVQPAGKTMMTAVSWMNGRRAEPARLR